MALTDILEYASVTQTAEHFATGEHAVRTGVADGSIPSIRLGRAIRIPLRMMVEHLAEQVAGIEPADFPDLEVVV